MQLRNLACLTVIALTSATLVAADDEAKPRRRVRLGGINVSAGYSRWSGPGFYPAYAGYGYYPGYWGMYSPWYDPFYMGWLHPGFYSGFARQPNMGEIKLKEPSKDAEVYLDGAYAGTVQKLKNMWLEPGVYNLELRSGDRVFRKRIYVLSGKTMELRPEMVAVAREEKP
jgi:hypothetical protein